jgi:hypothetical protein
LTVEQPYNPELLPGSSVQVDNPFEPGHFVVVTVPPLPDAVPGRAPTLRATFPKPVAKMQQLQNLGFKSEAQQLEALRRTAGDVAAAADLLRRVAFQQQQQQQRQHQHQHQHQPSSVQHQVAPQRRHPEVGLTHAVAEDVADEGASLVVVQYTGYEEELLGAVGGRVATIRDPFTQEVTHKRIPADWARGQPLQLWFKRPLLLDELQLKVPGEEDAKYIVALKRGKTVDEAHGILSLLRDLRRVGGDACAQLTDSECVELLHFHSYQTVQAIQCAVTTDIGAIRRYAATLDRKEFEQTLAETRQRASARDAKKRSEEFFLQVKANTDAMGLSDVTPERVEELVRCYGFNMDEVISALFQ